MSRSIVRDDRSSDGRGAAALMLERLEQLLWWRDEVLPRVTPDRPVDLATAAVVVRSRALCHRSLGELLPDLAARREDRPSQHLDSVRAWQLVRRRSENTWSELAGCSAKRIASWPDVGRSVAIEVIAAAIRAWALGVYASARTMTDRLSPADVVDDVGGNAAGSTGSAGLRPAQERTVKLAAQGYREGAQPLLDSLQSAATTGGPAAARAWSELAQLGLADLLGLPGPEAAWQRLLCFDDRERHILHARTFAEPRSATLAELGEQLGVTRERVRQIENRTKAKIQERLSSDPACLPIAHLTARLSAQLGARAPAEAVEAALAAAVPDAAGAELRRAVLLHLAGPYRFNDGAWQRATSP